jgi:hypothetical protein
VIAAAQSLIYLAFYVAIFALSVWALVDMLRRPAQAFLSAGKQTKQRWTIILGFLALLAAVAAVVYLVDVRPAVGPYSGRRGGGSGSGPSRGGW